MLRLGTSEIAGDDQGPISVPPALITRALGDFASERLASGAPGFAIEQLCAALVEDAPGAAQTCIDRLIDCGVSVEALYDTYLPRAAARLGELWVDDRLSFTAVTLGMARLTEAFRRLSPVFLKNGPPAPRTAPARRALFALAPGEDHALGVVMAADYFQRGGWSVRVELTADPATLEAIARRQPFDVIGLSAGSRRMIPDLRSTVARLRAGAMSRARFLLGGPLVALQPGIAQLVGVDLAVGAAQSALDELMEGA